MLFGRWFSIWPPNALPTAPDDHKSDKSKKGKTNWFVNMVVRAVSCLVLSHVYILSSFFVVADPSFTTCIYICPSLPSLPPSLTPSIYPTLVPSAAAAEAEAAPEAAAAAAAGGSRKEKLLVTFARKWSANRTGE